MGWKTLIAAFIVSFVSVSTAQAGLFDFLFKPRQPARVEAAAAPAPAVRAPVARKPAKRPVETRLVVLHAPIDMEAGRARVIDPEAIPDWHLIDPTLRRGDILVLRDRVVVFAGGAIGAPKSYVALSRSRLVSRSERASIALAARPDPMTIMTAEGGPRQPRMLKSATAVMPPVLGLRGSGS